ncbi:NUDIX hydrolase [Noviherbaspirillum malthae]|uniref:NUDIX hydrolase n=1 Tax=Noviherbaspirillum malthae TaxID=1260987 RepID=UPI00189086E0|nr:NUDIX hydrolase [Noviherbaspirillum malthae]
MTLPEIELDVATSCGTVIVNRDGKILLAHVTGTRYWDIPKGVQEYDESPFEAAKRELYEETGLVFDDDHFLEIGDFDYLADKRLYLFFVRAPANLQSLAHLKCTSHFRNKVTGLPTVEMDDFRWASRSEIARLCTPEMADRLLSLHW